MMCYSLLLWRDSTTCYAVLCRAAMLCYACFAMLLCLYCIVLLCRAAMPCSYAVLCNTIQHKGVKELVVPALLYRAMSGCYAAL